VDWRVGADVGGTFTDLVMVDGDTGDMRLAKVPSTPEDPSIALETGLLELLGTTVPPEAVGFFGHGTTVATNAVLQSRLALTGLITTRGFRDLLDIQRQKRPDVYDVYAEKPVPIVPRHLRAEVDERTLYNGTIERPLTADSAAAAIRALVDQGVESIAICLLHSYVNPAHELELERLCREHAPNVHVSRSSEVNPEFREFERLSTTVLNAALQPVVAEYLTRLEGRVRSTGIPVRPLILQSNGGMAPPTAAAETPISILFSGPSAGVIGASNTGEQAGRGNLITFDMGGTSTETSLIHDGNPGTASARLIAGFPIRAAMVDVVSIGAGGGSIASVDVGGMLQVGPTSAGADPGPACYARGGLRPTVTDANLLLSRLDASDRLAGKVRLVPERARDAMMSDVGQPLGINVLQAATAVLDVVHANIAEAINLVSVERGFDPRAFDLMAFGGAGPLHAADLAAVLGIRTVIVPPTPGLLCALGLLVTDVRSEFTRTRVTDMDSSAPGDIQSLFAELETRAADWLERGQLDAGAARYVRSMDMRYRGQNYEIQVGADDIGADLKVLETRFNEAHERLHGYSAPGTPTQVVNLRVTCHAGPRSQQLRPGYRKPIAAKRQERTVHFRDQDLVTQILARDSLGVSTRFEGPAIVTQMDSTTLVPPGFEAYVDDCHNLILTNQAIAGSKDAR
jgi:N-methylhydantoinase A